MSDDDGEVWQYGSVLIPLLDAWPSSAISSAVWSPATNHAIFSFHSGESVTAPCTVTDWLGYKSSGSRGSYFNTHFRKPPPPKKPAAAATGINRNPYGKARF